MDALLGTWLLAASAAVGAGQPATSASPANERIDALIRQLGDPSFARRSAATKALVAEGEKIVPLLERARKGADLELIRRIDRIRYQVIGYQDDLTAFLSGYTDAKARPELPADVRSLVAAHQPKSGDFLLKIIADPDHRLHRGATHLYCETWSSGSAEQLQLYLQSCFTLQAFHRPRYPESIDAYIETRYWHRYGWSGWPKELQWQTRITHFLDGKPYGKPFEHNYPGGGATTGWINVGKLPEGKHGLCFEVDIAFTHEGAKRQSTVRSREFAFTVGPTEPNDLIAPTGGVLAKQVREALVIVEHGGPQEGDPLIFQGGGQRLHIDWWRPQITWEDPPGRRRGLRVPEWTLTKRLAVDLCFEVTIRDVKSGKTFAADPLVVPKGQTSLGYFAPRDARAFAKDRDGKDRDGFVEVEIDLQPSRSVALTHPEITSYFGWPITSKALRAKVVREIREMESK